MSNCSDTPAHNSLQKKKGLLLTFFSRRFQKPSRIKLLLTLFKKASRMKKFTNGFLKTACKKIIHDGFFFFFFKTVVTYVDGLDKIFCKGKFTDSLKIVWKWKFTDDLKIIWNENLQTVWPNDLERLNFHTVWSQTVCKFTHIPPLKKKKKKIANQDINASAILSSPKFFSPILSSFLSISSLHPTDHHPPVQSTISGKKGTELWKTSKTSSQPKSRWKTSKILHVQAFDKGSQKWQENYPRS
jgi:hypothetical protein